MPEIPDRIVLTQRTVEAGYEAMMKALEHRLFRVNEPQEEKDLMDAFSAGLKAALGTLRISTT